MLALGQKIAEGGRPELAKPSNKIDGDWQKLIKKVPSPANTQLWEKEPAKRGTMDDLNVDSETRSRSRVFTVSRTFHFGSRTRSKNKQ